MVMVRSSALREMAFEMLEGYGDASLGEWIEDRPKALHLRRRLTVDEQARVGDPMDCRGTEEGKRRLLAIENMFPPALLRFAEAELNQP